MEGLRDAFVGLFKRSDAVDEPFVDGLIDGSAELKAKDVVELMQQKQLQQQPEEQQPKQPDPKQQKVFYDNERLHRMHDPADGGDSSQTSVNYEMEFVQFINRNAPQGFSHKLNSMLPYIGASFITWPTYWLWRGYHWQTRRRTERIAVYIQRTFQHAKLMQVAILSIGLLMAASAHGASEPLEVHEVSYEKKRNT